MRQCYEAFMPSKDVGRKYNRKGKCDYKKCKAACCRFMLISADSLAEGIKGYWKGHGFDLIYMNGKAMWLKDSPCTHLDLKTYKCKLQKNKPIICQQFPIPHDAVYKKVIKVCSYRFPKEQKIMKMGCS